MFMANDLNGQRVDIEDALNNGEELYTCPSCNKQVFRKKVMEEKRRIFHTILIKDVQTLGNMIIQENNMNCVSKYLCRATIEKLK